MSYSTLYNLTDTCVTILATNTNIYSIEVSAGASTSKIFSYNIATRITTLLITFNDTLINGAVLNESGTIIYYVIGNFDRTLNNSIVSFNISSNVSTTLFTFNTNGSNGTFPNSSPILYNNTLYGTCSSGGIYRNGVIYSYNIVTQVYTFYSFLFPFNPSDSGLTLNSATNILYGVYNNPLLSTSSIYSINTTLTTNTTLNTANVQPFTNRLYYNSSNNKLYGTSQYQTGTTNFGTLFCLDTNGENYTTIYRFLNNNTIGYNPQSNIVLYDNTLYFTTRGGIDNTYTGSKYGTLLSIPSTTTSSTTPKLEYTFTITNSCPLSIVNVSNILYGFTIRDQTLSTNPAVVYSYTVIPVCFNQNTQILCIDKDLKEKYMSIKKIKKGTLVKTYKHGYRKVDLIGKKTMKNDPSSLLNCMYKFKSIDETMPDLIVTGLHSICVDKLSDKEIEACKKYNFESSKIDDKYLLPACVSDKFEKIQNRNIYTYYHLTLENDGNENAQYAIMANGVLTETTCENNFKRTGFMLTN
jgi:hypothetical protein